MAVQKWTNLIRFVSEGKVYYGNASPSLKTAQVIIGNPFGSSYQYGETKQVEQLLSPIAQEDLSTIRGLGLNFKKHAAEAKAPEPKYPIVFNKPITALNGPYSPIYVPTVAQLGEKLDYEVELVIVVGKPCYNASKAEALDYVAGYTVGNDVSERAWQIEKCGGQWGFGKSFDGWAPIGPQIVSKEALPDISAQRVECFVNGEKRQSELLSDMIFSVADAIEFLSQGQTLMPGDLIFMGTPSGVGMGNGKWVKNGDIVECSLTGVGSVINKFIFKNDSISKL